MPEKDLFSQTGPQTQESPSGSPNFDMGYLLLQNGHFSKSLPYLKKAMRFFLEEKKLSQYCEAGQLIFQALFELEDKGSAQKLREEMDQTAKKEGFEKSPGFLAVSAYCRIYIEKDLDTAKKELNEALKIAFDKHDSYVKAGNRLKQNRARIEIIVCLYIYAAYYYETNNDENCLQELRNLNILLKDYAQLKKRAEWDHSRSDNAQELKKCHEILTDLKKNFPKLIPIQLGTKLLSAFIALTRDASYSRADKLLWELYEEANKTGHTFLIPYILCAMAKRAARLKNKQQARMFLSLAEKNSNPERKLLASYIKKIKREERLDQMESSEDYDLIFDIKDHLIVEKDKGCIDLKNQFVLMDLLKLFLLNPGEPYSKEAIIQKIWGQSYEPETHDNKIYVTIKRLREMIEADSRKPRYICRNSAGYGLAKGVKVLVKQ